jgi:hypothetical protein
MLQYQSASAVKLLVALALFVLAGCCSAPGQRCFELAVPQPKLTNGALQRCLTDVLADEIEGGTRYSLEVRAGARDVIVERHIIEFLPLRRRAAKTQPHDIVSAASTSFALDALTLLRDPEAVSLNASYIHPDTEPLLLSAAISNLTFLHDTAAADQVAKVAEKLAIDDQRDFVMVSVLEYLAAAKYASEPVCRRLNSLTRYADGCAHRCNPGTVTMLRRAIAQYTVAASCQPH